MIFLFTHSKEKFPILPLLKVRSILLAPIICWFVASQVLHGQTTENCTPPSSGYCNGVSLLVEQIPLQQFRCGGFTDCSNVAYGIKFIGEGVPIGSNVCATSVKVKGSIISNGTNTRIHQMNSNPYCTFNSNSVSFSIENEVEFTYHALSTSPLQVPLFSNSSLFGISVEVGIGETVSLHISEVVIEYDEGITHPDPCVFIEGNPNNSLLIEPLPTPYSTDSTFVTCNAGVISFDSLSSNYQNIDSFTVIPVRFEDGNPNGRFSELDVVFEIASTIPIPTPEVDFGTLVQQSNNVFTYYARRVDFNSGVIGNIKVFEPWNSPQGTGITIRVLNARLQNYQISYPCCSPIVAEPLVVTFDGPDVCNPDISMLIQGDTLIQASVPCQTRSLISFVGSENTIEFTKLCVEIAYETTGDLQIVDVVNEHNGLPWLDGTSSNNVFCGFPNQGQISSYDSVTQTIKFCYQADSVGEYSTVLSNTGFVVVFEGTFGCILNTSVLTSNIALLGSENEFCTMTSIIDTASLQMSCVQRLGGTMTQANGSPAPNVKLYISHPSNSLSSVSINESDCSKTSYGICSEQQTNFEITPAYMGDNYLNGVNTFDLVLISRHVLGVQNLDSPYKIIAADVNKTNSVTTADLVELRKVVILLSPTFFANSWRYIPKDFVFPNPLNPFETTFPESIVSAQTNVSNDFIAIKIGDVNENATCALGRQEVSSASSNARYSASMIGKDVWQVDFFQESDFPLVALQGVLKLKYGTIISHNTLHADAFTQEPLVQKNVNTIRIIWVQADGYSTLGKGEKMFTLIVKSAKWPAFEWDLQDGMPTLAYTALGEEIQLNLSEIKDAAIPEPYLGLEVQVFPNPIQKGDPLQMKLKSAFDGPVQILIQNSTGSFYRSTYLELQKDKEAIQSFNLNGTTDEVLFYQVISTKGNVTGTILLK